MGTLGSRSLFHMGTRGAARGRGRARQACARSPPRLGCPKAPTIRRPNCSRNATACRPAMSSAPAVMCRATNRPIRRPACPTTSRRSGWSAAPAPRSRSIPRPATSASAAHQRRRLRQPINPRRRAHAAFRRRDHAARLHAVRSDAPRRRSDHQRVARRLQDSRHPRHSADGERGSSRPSSIRVRSAPRVVGEIGPSACRRRSPMRSTTPSASASWNCRSPPKRSARVARQRGPPAGRRVNGRMIERAHHQFHAQRPAGSADIEPHRNLVELLQTRSICSAPAKAAARGCAAAAPCWSTARRCRAAFISRLGRRQDGHHHRALDADGALIRCSKPLSNAARSNAASARRASSMMAQAIAGANNPDPRRRIRHYLSGNLCRCAAYPEIIEAVQLAAKG